MTLTREHIAYLAALNPDDLAVIDHDREYSYGQLDRNLAGFTHALNRFGLPAGSTVAVERTSLYEHWLILLAFETLGVATYSYAPENLPTLADYLRTVDMVFCSEEAIPQGAKRVQTITQTWLQQSAAQAPETGLPQAAVSPNAPVRIHFSSGTTGTPKRIIKTRRIHEFWVWQNLVRAGCSPDTRYLVSQSFCLLGTYYFATACLRMGGTVVYDSRSALRAISRHGVTDVTLLPNNLAQVLERLPSDFKKLPELTVYTFGGHVTAPLRDRALARFASKIVESYGANEIGAICTINADGTGAVLPGIAVQVVDADDRPIAGEPGRIRVKGGGIIDSYPDDKAATDRMFRNGWFYPGDTGIMNGSRRLKLLGRDDEIINLGGIKVRPETIEEILSSHADVLEVCVTAIDTGGELSGLWAACVLTPNADLSSVRRDISPRLSRNWHDIRLVEIDEIPKTASGKVQRYKVAERIQESAETRR